ncbi:MAG: hypothetical protein MZW92_79720 [Comamonadaceae bacterium]|nr:hypothetical protein [Comamonadaceae bacterium]
MLADGLKHEPEAGERRPRRRRLPAVHRRHHRRGQGRDADRTATSSPTCCRREAWISRRCKLSPASTRSPSRALPLYHIFALTANCLMFMQHRRPQRADHQPARHPRLRQGTAEVHVPRRSPASTRCSTRC